MEQEFVKKQNRKVTIFACLLSVISIGLLIFGFTLVSSDKVVLLQSISNLSSKIDKVLEHDSLLLDKMATSKDIGMRSNLKIVSGDMNVSLSFDYLENREDKKSKATVDVMMNDEELLGADLALSDDNIHFFIDDITPHYYYTALEYISIFSSLNSSDYDKILVLLKESVNDYIDDQDIKTEKVEISYHGKDKKVNKLTYEITNKTIKDIMTNFINSIKKDKTLLEHIASYMDISLDELTNDFDELLNSLDYEEESVLYYYRVYYYGFNKIVGYQIEEYETNFIVEYKIDDQESIHFYDDNAEVFSLEITKNKNQYDLKGFIAFDDFEEIPFSGTLSDNTLTLVVYSDAITLKVAITSDYEETDNHFYSKDHVILSSIMNDEEEELCTIDLESEYYFDQKVDVDLSSSQDIDEITEEDLNKIYENIMNHPIYQLITNISENYGFSL